MGIADEKPRVRPRSRSRKGTFTVFPRRSLHGGENEHYPQVSTIESRARRDPERPRTDEAQLCCSQWAGPPATREKSGVDVGERSLA